MKITTNYVLFGEDIEPTVQTLVAYKADDDSVEAVLTKEIDSPPDYPNGLSSSNETPPIVEALPESSSFPWRKSFLSTTKYISFVAQLQLRFQITLQ